MTTHVIRLTTAAACLGTLLLGAPALAVAQPVSQSADTVESTIEQRWAKDGQLKACKGCDIDIEFANGVATLTGEVPTAALKARAERLAKVDAVTRVDNQIAVQTETSVADKTRKGVNKAVSKTGDAISSTGEVINDGWITTKVKSKMTTADELEGSAIDVDTKNNVVTLSGNVKTESMREAALRVARSTEGVKRVVDKLTVTP
jgi:hyperosmotically inducible protein